MIGSGGGGYGPSHDDAVETSVLTEWYARAGVRCFLRPERRHRTFVSFLGRWSTLRPPRINAQCCSASSSSGRDRDRRLSRKNSRPRALGMPANSPGRAGPTCLPAATLVVTRLDAVRMYLCRPGSR